VTNHKHLYLSPLILALFFLNQFSSLLCSTPNLFAFFTTFTALAIMPAIHSTLYCATNPFLLDLEECLANLVLHAHFQGMIGGFILDYNPSQLNIITHLHHHVT
jgi:hypothetical protein